MFIVFFLIEEAFFIFFHWSKMFQVYHHMGWRRSQDGVFVTLDIAARRFTLQLGSCSEAVFEAWQMAKLVSLSSLSMVYDTDNIL